MKKILSSLAAIALLFACQPENTPGGTTEVVATAIKLSTNDLTLEKGANEVLTVTFTPSNTTKKDVTWVSSNTSIATVADGIVVGVAPGSTEIIAKCGDATDKCKVSVVISATGIKLNITSLELKKGDSETLVATVEPAESTDNITWETSDEAVATVADGVVTAIGAGEATITAQAGSQKAECKVTAFVIPDGAVDLGIVMTRGDGSTYNLYWAKSNLCESGLCANPEDYGDYYAWGETEPKESYNSASYHWCNGDFNDKLTKYCRSWCSDRWDGEGSPDNKTILDAEDDAAHVKLGGKWRMPTKAERDELMSQCTWIWTTENGVNGYKVTASNGNCIFLPAAGYRRDTNLDFAGSRGYYWSSSLGPLSPGYALMVYFYSEEVFMGDADAPRCDGFSVRPVSE